MRNRLILYWVVLILSLFSAALLILSILGVMPGAGLKVLQTLMIQQQNTQLVIVKQTDSMMARGIALSEEVTKILTNKLTSKGMTFSDINDNPEFIKELEQSMYPILKSALDIQYCSGAFIVLDATVNTKTDIADTSRMGLYLRLSDLKTVNTYNQHMVYFCGNPDIAREQKVELHNWWNLEFDTKDLLGYQQVMQHKENRLVESCIWTERLILKDTWEDMMLLYIPIVDSTGRIRWACGMEMSDLYFQLSYPVVEGPYGKMITVLAPVNGKDEIELEKGMLGNAAGTYLSATGKMKVTKGKYYNTYDTSVGKYIGIHHLLNLKTSNGQPFALMVLISKTNYDHIMGNSRKVWIIGSLTFLICLLFFSFVLSKRFVKPILQSLRAIQEDEMKPDVQSVIYAVDRLITYLSSQKKLLINKNRELPKDVEDMINDFISRVETLTSAERSLLQCFIEGDSMQGCADKLCISIGTARKHNTNMNRKLGISSRKELLLYIDLLRNCNRLDSITNPKS